MWENRSKIIFISVMCIAGLVYLQIGMYALHVLLGWQVKFNLIQICKNEILLFGFSPLGDLLDVFVFYTIALSVWIVLKQLILSNKVYKSLLSFGYKKESYLFNRGSISQEVIVISHPTSLAMTIGLFQPKIVISTGLIDLLDKNELDAVIHHERFHEREYDPLKIFSLSLFASVLWYIPILKWLLHKYKIIREVLADHSAIENLGASLALGTALLKLLKNKSSGSKPYSFVSFTETSIKYRIEKIIDPGMKMTLKLPLITTIISLCTLLLLCTLFIIALS
jgi:beta-lactamase regulating signal transducer with metallopeptidase domain